jgi:hypothetical protein
MNWFDLAQDRGTLRALVDAVINIQFLKIRGISLLHEDLLVFQEGMYLFGWVGWLVNWNFYTTTL